MRKHKHYRKMYQSFYVNRQYEPSTATAPNYWNMATIGGTVGGAGRKGNSLMPSTVVLSPEDRASVWYFYRNFAEVSGAVNHFISEVMHGGFEVIVQLPGKKIEFSPENEENIHYFTHVLMPGVRRMIFDWIMFGYTRVQIMSPNKKDEFEYPLFDVLREGITNEIIEWKGNRRFYKLFYASTFQGDAAGKKVPNGHILVMDNPFDDGGLNSRVTRVFGPLRQLKQLWHNYNDSMYYTAHPPYVITPEQDKNRRSAEEEFRMVEAAEAAIEGTSEARQQVRMRIIREQAEEDRLASIHTNPGAANSSSGMYGHYNNASLMPRGNPALTLGGPDEGGLSSLASAASVMMEEPWRHGITLPRGHKMNSVPTARAPEGFLQVSEHLLHKVVRSIGIPPGMLEGGIGQKHAASVEMGNKELATNITLLHQQAEILLRDFFRKVFRSAVDSSVMDRAVEEGQEKNPDYLREQMAGVKVDVKFRYHPIITLESLVMLHEQGIVNSEAKRDVGLRLFGMPEEYGEPDPDKALAKRQEAMVTADSKGKAVLEKVKQQAKPASSTTSSSSGGGTKRKQSSTSSFSSSSNKKQK